VSSPGGSEIGGFSVNRYRHQKQCRGEGIGIMFKGLAFNHHSVMRRPRARTLIKRCAKNSCSAMGFSISYEWAVVALGYTAGAAFTASFLLMQPVYENNARSRWTLDLAIFVMSILWPIALPLYWWAMRRRGR
jgi:hypothetical protein